ncbi:biotin carboxylase N-terminal domain-containing protein [Brevibacterium jeotgali]|uniref:biotin carboxylase n=1 Tax=Brevibacterium jeotgali TaxID=1262550 RepID=A0A2H1L188_9MICO|nr:biotin carboxylase N-terminal domain-containing protein [Brevibacterium jeotgali]TWC02050.1 acetyl-CoA/propionyl-CoA carboxylase biotin carboxyl carrier protein [Brevibacterium jeotgali]SMY10599.1 acetyl-CoA/propionyl-CoA carboxylase, biotin carboxylase, biotin carboxyl carrier protein [Brevibacterium jeotgali]
MFTRILIANRGEIALRVIRTCRALGIETVAVYSDADADAAHTRAADVAHRLGPAPAAQSYLDIERVVAAVRATGAQAVHPGYGFLSENAAFARRLEEEGIVFLGPTAASIDVMGDKISAKRAVAARGVPLVPGVAEPGLTDEQLIARADEVGFPILVKPSAGGGGKGMREVHDPADLAEALASARREAAGSFGDDTLFLERLVLTPRHIEVQVLADEHGNVIHLGERECSLQRRHQKVIEEAPSALLDEATRARIGQAAVDTAKSVDYRGAGTVEFIVSADNPDEFFFMEMNTRLQVEHPVTEQVTGVDLVEWQLRIGAGQQLALAQDDVTLTGHSIEARIYAEDPARGFLPTGGTALDVSFPTGEGIRVDAGLEPGQRIVSDYDPMIAKLIVTARDRQEAVARTRTALAGSAVPGIVTNIGFLQTLLEMPEVVAGDLHTGLIDAMTEDDLAEAVDPAALQLAAAHVAAAEADRATDSHIAGEPVGMWADGSGWRGVAPARTVVPLVHRGERHDVEFLHPPVRARGNAADRSGAASGSVIGAPGAGSTLRLTLEGEQVTGRVWASADGRTLWVRTNAGLAQLTRPRADTAIGAAAAGAEVLAPMPGSVTGLRAEDGETVVTGQPVVVVEAMKMEHVLTAPADGVVQLSTVQGAQVALDEVLAVIVPEDAEAGADAGTGIESGAAADAVLQDAAVQATRE